MVHRARSSPVPGSFASREPAVSSPSWWDKGCLCACIATASVDGPCPEEPDVYVAPFRRLDDRCIGGTNGSGIVSLGPDRQERDTFTIGRVCAMFF